MLRALRRCPFGPWYWSGLRRSRMNTSGASRTVSLATAARTTRNGGFAASRARSQRLTVAQPASAAMATARPARRVAAATIRRLAMPCPSLSRLVAGAPRPPALALRPAVLSLRGERRVHRVVGREQLVQAGDLQQLADAVGRVHQHQLALEAAETPEVADQLADAGRVDEVDAAEIDDHVPLVVGQRAVEGLREELGALAELDHALDVEEGISPFQMALLDDHGGSGPDNEKREPERSDGADR